jgi:hypothetical protein
VAADRCPGNPPDRRASVAATARVGFVVLIGMAVVLTIIGGRTRGSDPAGGTAVEATPAVTAAPAKRLVGRFIRWEAVDEKNGYAYFSGTNNRSEKATAECTVSVKNDIGNFGFDIMVGEDVAAGETISGKMALSVGQGSFLINEGEVTNC